MISVLKALAGLVFATMGVAWGLLLALQGVLGLATMRSDAGDFEEAAVAVLQRLSEADPTTGYAICVVLVVLGVLLIFWHPHRFAASRAAPRLYLHTFANGQTASRKSYIVAWSPRDYFFPVFSDFESYGSSFPPGEPLEKAITLHLFNAGPGPVRHVRATWSLGRLDIVKAVRSAGLFEGCTDLLTPSFIKLRREGVGAISRPLANKEAVSIAIVADEQTLALNAPEGFSTAFSTYALAEAKRLTPKTPIPPMPALQGAIEQMAKTTARMHPVRISLKYVSDDGVTRRQRFILSGWIHGGSSTIKKAPNHEGAYEMDPDGVMAWIDRMEVHEA